MNFYAVLITVAPIVILLLSAAYIMKILQVEYAPFVIELESKESFDNLEKIES